MDLNQYMEILHLAERLKNNTRHSWTSEGRHESVAEHSFRLALMAFFMKDRFPEADMDKVIRMCLLHDMGEAFTGDIPTFEKTDADTEKEEKVLEQWVQTLPEPFREELGELYHEMEAMQSQEARICKALDKMEAVIQHNEADISTWLPLEYELQLIYGGEETEFSPVMKELKARVNEDSRIKICESGFLSGKNPYEPYEQ